MQYRIIFQRHKYKLALPSKIASKPRSLTLIYYSSKQKYTID